MSTVRVRDWLRLLLLLLLGYLAVSLPNAQAQGPHIGNRSYGPDQLMQIQSQLDSSNGAPNLHSSVIFNGGYVVEVYSSEGDQPQSGIAVYDLSDPSHPRLVSHTDARGLSEQHTIGFTQLAGRTYTAHLAVDGIAIWDWTDMTQPREVSRLALPGVYAGYTHGAWWLSWQMPFLYVSGAGNGIYIVDTSDLDHPRLADRAGAPNPLPYTQTGGFRVGSIFAVGNLLVTSSNDGRGYATLDISDPVNPLLLSSRVADAPPSYSSMLNGNRLYAAGTDNLLYGFDISDPHDIRLVGTADLAGRGGYLTIQDGFAQVGASVHYMKVDISHDGDYKTLGSARSNNREADEDFVVALGNLVVISDDHDNGSIIVPHQAEPDKNGPLVNMVIPSAGATNQSRTTRVGLTFSDLIDLRSVNTKSIIVRPVNGNALEGSYSTQTGIVNFSPLKPLEPDTTYEVIVPAQGVVDVMGNGVPTSFQSTFSTGNSIAKSLWCAIDSPAPVPVSESVDFHISTTPSPDRPTVSWEYGDSTTTSTLPLMPEISHSYNQAGRYSVHATVKNSYGVTSCTVRATVYLPPTAAHPQNSSTIILDSSGTQVWNVNPDNDSVTVIDAVRESKMAEIAVGHQPRTLAQAPDGAIWVVNQSDATITVIDQNTHSILTTIALPRGSEPYGIVFSPRDDRAYASLQSIGQIAELDANSRSLSRTLDVGPTPRALAISADGRSLFVTRFISSPEQGSVVDVDPLAWQVRQRIPLVYDSGPDTSGSGRGVPNGLAALAISPAGDHLWVAARKSNTARGLQRDGQRLTFDSTVRSMLATVDLHNDQEILADRYDFNDRDGPVAMRFSPLGDYVFALLEGDNAIDIIDAYKRQLITSIDNIGHAPQGLVFTEDGGKLFVHSWLTRSVFVYDVSHLFGRDTSSPHLLAEISTVANDQMPPQVLAGKQIFYNSSDPRMSRDGYLSCASCHYDSRDDGQVWDRTAEGEGLRNTISLIGKGSPGHGKMHWSANFDEVQDFENDMRANFGGLGFMPDSIFDSGTISQPLGSPKASLSPQLDALAAYLDSLRELPASPYRDADGSLTADGEAGRVIFISAGCASCHGGPQFTDSPSGLRHQIGTLTQTSGHRLGKTLYGIDTPSLRGLWLSAPYLHDGSASTLPSIFSTRNPLGLYGSLQTFLRTNPRAIDELVAYLLQIDDSEPAFDLPSLAIDMVEPTDNGVFSVVQSILFQVNISSMMGPGETVDYFANDQAIGTTRGPLYSLRWQPEKAGDYVIEARLNYLSGASTASTPRHLKVLP